MDKIKNLTSGSILKGIGGLAAPLIGASFIQMTYGMTDMIWLGKLGSGPVAAVGVAFFFIWICNAISFIPKIGAEISISQSLGAGFRLRAKAYAAHAALISMMIALIYSLFVLGFAPKLIGFFGLDADIASLGTRFLRLIVPAIFVGFNNYTFSGIYYGAGNSKTPFRINAIGLALNIVLDPLFIFGLGPIPAMGIDGAALATTLAQVVVFGIFLQRLYGSRSPLGKLHININFKPVFARRIFKLGSPVALQSCLFAIISMSLAQLAASFGHIGVAVQSLGCQIEAVSWMTAAGFSTALGSFVGQNYGARNYDRIRKGYNLTLLVAGSIGFVVGIVFIFFGREVFSAFITEPETLAEGAKYLRILGLSQLFMVVETVTAGGFNGVGRTQPPACTSILLNLVRIPLAYYLVSIPSIGLTGIWWSITGSSILKGIVLTFWFHAGELRKLKPSIVPEI